MTLFEYDDTRKQTRGLVLEYVVFYCPWADAPKLSVHTVDGKQHELDGDDVSRFLQNMRDLCTPASPPSGVSPYGRC